MFWLKLSLFILLFLFTIPQGVFAADIGSITIVNPIRGQDFWKHSQGVLDTPLKQYGMIGAKNLAATWLVRFDALKDPEVVKFLKGLNKDQEIGLFLEITPSWAEEAGVVYHPNTNWHHPQSVFLMGYTPSERERLIDTVMSRYRQSFGRDPLSVGAWWIDAFSLNYLREKYKIEANLAVADQYSTDQYQVWGQYWSTPFYPSKNNALMPAQSREQKLGVVTMQWAPRDPFNGYGSGSFDSTFSMQPNDYLLHKLDYRYFEKLIGIYLNKNNQTLNQVIVGVENDFSWTEIGGEYEKQIEIIAQGREQGKWGVETMAGFAKRYSSLYPDISPNILIKAEDPLGSGGQVIWYQTPKFRFGWFYIKGRGSIIRDLRLYNDSLREKCFNTPCDSLNLASEAVNALDDVTFSSRFILDEGAIDDLRVTQEGSTIIFSYRNQGNNLRTIKLLPNDIVIDNRVQTLSNAILYAKTTIQDLGTNQIEPPLEGNILNIQHNFGQILVNGLKFILIFVLFFLLPGWLLTRQLVLSVPVGIALFTLFSFLVGVLKVSFLVWLIPAVSLTIFFKYRPKTIEFTKISPQLLLLLGLILGGSVTWLLTVAKSGLTYGYGLGYWGPNGHDGIWHLALISELQKNIPPNNPVFAGERLTNYHYFFDLLVASTANLISINIQDLLFRLFPLLISVLLGWIMFEVGKRVFASSLAGVFATFFLYFGGSFGWIVSYFKDRSLGGESFFWSQQAISTLLNPPYAISLLLLLGGILLLCEYFKQGYHKMNIFISLSLVFGTLIAFKAYAGVLSLAGLGAIALYQILFRRDFRPSLIFLSCSLLAVGLFLSNNSKSASLITLSPLWLVHSMVDFPDRLGWLRLALARQAYFTGGNILKLFGAEAIGLLIFIAGNLGTRLLFLFGLPKLLSQTYSGDKIMIFLSTILILGFIIPLLFIQNGNSWNIVQFFYYSQVVAGIFAAAALAFFWDRVNRLVGIAVVLLIMLLTIPTTVGTLFHYLPQRPPAKLSYGELEALEFLRSQPEGKVLTLPFDKDYQGRFGEPRPLFSYTSTAYVSAFSQKNTFLEDTVNLEILGVDYKGRLNEERDLIKFKDRAREVLRRNSINYIYAVKKYGFNEDEGGMNIKKIFENNEVKIFKVLN